MSKESMLEYCVKKAREGDSSGAVLVYSVATDIDILMLSDVLREIEADIRRKYPKYFMMDISIHTRFLI